MKKYILLVLGLLIATALLARPTEQEIQAASASLNVPYDELSALVDKYNVDIPEQEFIEISLNQLYSEAGKNPVATIMKYDGKILRIKFTAESINTNTMYGYDWDETGEYKYTINAETDYSPSTWTEFSCYINNSEEGKLLNIVSGSDIVVQGLCHIKAPYQTSIVLYDTVILDYPILDNVMPLEFGDLSMEF